MVTRFAAPNGRPKPGEIAIVAAVRPSAGRTWPHTSTLARDSRETSSGIRNASHAGLCVPSRKASPVV